MEQTSFKIIKLNNGDDIICKIVNETTDTVTVERPLSLVEEISHKPDRTALQTGFNKWLSFSSDNQFQISKNKILTVGNLNAEMRYYYKTLCKRLIVQEENEPKTEEEVADRISYMQKSLNTIMEESDLIEESDNIIDFNSIMKDDKTNLH